ncbi:MAG: alpha/beta fold hydrolase [Dehalococcoidia bacterium]|jgi:pimeloyl-ACP methyl ester carboxylesterase|nr:alpha/beta fold hydrolase [Dehalococcoidia bacterium]MDW8009844.1 alpha/beta fold hydrolase [Chloroflexota bacterium]WBU15413.1 4,5:9,10-diseco-3-hydroxy-5,9, 17-trioxoandrosta-1(10),2-diene-4-oate hydrolase [uncultured bacterium]
MAGNVASGPRGTMLEVWQGRVKVSVKTAGDGPPLVYFHAAAGLRWDDFLDGLARHFTVHAPELPGTGDSDPHDIYQVDSLWDLVLIMGDVLDALGLRDVPLVGHSFGAMLAAEVAAHWPERFSRLVLISPIGLWRQERPVTNWMSVPIQDLPRLMFRDLSAPAVQRLLALPQDQEEMQMAQAKLVWALGCSGKFVWPIPDKGLKKRLHRVRVPTLLVWGREDAVVPAEYAQDFAAYIQGARTLVVDGAGHVPQLEKLDQVLPAVLEFLRG